MQCPVYTAELENNVGLSTVCFGALYLPLLRHNAHISRDFV